MTLRIGTADYDPDTSFKAPKIDLGGMTLVEEATRPIAFAGRTAPATIIVLSGKEADLGDDHRGVRHAYGVSPRGRPDRVARGGVHQPQRRHARAAPRRAACGPEGVRNRRQARRSRAVFANDLQLQAVHAIYIASNSQLG